MKAARSGMLALALALVVLAVVPGHASEARQFAPNGAGLVIRHGDGTLIYAYVEFEGETITGEDLLLRSGLDFVVSPYAGLGTGVCAIDGEGCPADNCYCQSYSNPAYYWQYFGWNGSGWDTQLRGPTTRQLADGEIDGWSWTAGDPGLPPVSIDEIAAITGFDRTPEPTATPTLPDLPTATLVPTDTAVPTPAPTATNPPPTATPAPTPTALPTGTATTAPPASPTNTALPTATGTATRMPPASTATIAPATPTEPPTPTHVPPASSATNASAEPTPTPGAGAVIVRPGESPQAIEPVTDTSASGSRSFLLFGGAAVIILLAGSLILARNRRSQR